MSDLKNDPLLARYREASAQESAGPSERIREAMLARAHERAAAPRALPVKAEAANDRAWRWKIAASFAAIGFTGMVARHYSEAPSAERVSVATASSAEAAADRKSEKNLDQTNPERVASANAAAPAATSRAPSGLSDQAANPPSPASAHANTPAAPRSATVSVATETAQALRSSEENAVGKESIRAQKVVTPQVKPNAANTAPEISPALSENEITAARDEAQSARTESLHRRQPEMSTGDAHLGALPSAPMPTPAPKRAHTPATAPMPAAEASLASGISAAPAPALVASAPPFAPPAPQVAAAPSAPIAAASRAHSATARSAEGRSASGAATLPEPALIAAIHNGDSEALRRELAAGASPNTLARDGTRALTLAVQRARTDDVAALLRAGATVNARDAQGRTALSAAQVLGFVEIVALLRAAGAVD